MNVTHHGQKGRSSYDKPSNAMARGCPRLQLLRLAFSLLCMTLVGCGGLLPWQERFGTVTPPASYRSQNGLSVHQEMWEASGATCLKPQKLSPRLDDFDVIVLVGQSYDPPGMLARDWLERWLRAEDGRTVIYFGRDFNAREYYFRRTLDELPLANRQRGEWLLSSTRADEMQLRISTLSESTFCRWFYLDTTTPRRLYQSFTGPWASDLSGLSGDWPVGITLQPPEASWRTRKPSWLANKNPTPFSNLSIGRELEDNRVQRSDWRLNELETDAAWNAEFEHTYDTDILLAGDDDRPLIYRLRGDDFGSSQLLIVANGAPFLNASLVDSLHREIASKLMTACPKSQRVALLAFDRYGILVSTVPEKDNRVAGLEMLTVWPLSAITMPIALLGVIIVAMLLPILGRPQQLRKRTTTDFGLHVEAIGRMLQDANDVQFASAAIRDYYTKVRGEAPPKWLEDVEVAQASSTPSTPSEPSVPVAREQAVGEAASGSGDHSVQADVTGEPPRNG